MNSEDIHRFLEGFQPGLQHIESYQLTAIPEYNFWILESIDRVGSGLISSAPLVDRLHLLLHDNHDHHDHHDHHGSNQQHQPRSTAPTSTGVP